MARPRGNIDRRIVRAARQLFLRDGVDGASLREVARRARTNLGMIYYYFPTKDALFLAVVEDVYPKLLEELSSRLASKHTTEERIRALFERVAECTDDEHDVIRLIVREALVSSERLSRLLDRFMHGHIPIVLGALAEGVDKGEVTAQPLPILMMIAIAVGLAPQIMRRRVGDRPPFNALPQGPELANVLSKLLFDGLRPR